MNPDRLSEVSQYGETGFADAIEVFTARCEARAYLWQEGELDLHEAVDVLQGVARSGLVAELGQDAVQAIMAKAFRAVGKLDLVEVAEVVPAPMPEAAPRHHGAADSTVDALMHGLRSRGIAALAERDTRFRLAALSTKQVREVIARLIALRPRYHAITDDLIFKLGRLL